MKRILAALRAAQPTALGAVIRRHTAAARIIVSAVCLTIVVAAGQQASQAGPETSYTPPPSILASNVGVGVSTTQPIMVRLAAPLDAASVEASLQVLPEADVRLVWSGEGRVLHIYPERRWAPDQRYLILIPSSVATPDGDPLGAPIRASFTTQTAPTVTGFALRVVTPLLTEDTELLASIDPGVPLDRSAPAGLVAVEPSVATPADVSATSRIAITFNTPMDRASVEDAFAITPDVPGSLSWEDGEVLIFTPEERLEPDARYTVSLSRSRDAVGNLLSGSANFSFTTAAGAQVVTVRPRQGEQEVQSGPLTLWFSGPMDTEAVAEAFTVIDLITEEPVAGSLSWDKTLTQLIFEPDDELAQGRSYEVRLDDGARDLDGNPVEISYRFSTVTPAPVQRAASPPSGGTTQPRPVAPAPAPPPSGDLVAYALQQVNSARAAYGFAPLSIDPAISAAASSHAWDMLNHGYFSHTGRDGSSVQQRLARAGVSFSRASENICMNGGRTALATLQSCHATFMAEPYPGHWNHIGNILNPNFTRMGVGIAEGGGRVIVVWDFAG